MSNVAQRQKMAWHFWSTTYGDLSPTLLSSFVHFGIDIMVEFQNIQRLKHGLYSHFFSKYSFLVIFENSISSQKNRKKVEKINYQHQYCSFLSLMVDYQCFGHSSFGYFVQFLMEGNDFFGFFETKANDEPMVLLLH